VPCQNPCMFPDIHDCLLNGHQLPDSRFFRGQLRHLLADTVVATALVVMHAIIIMCQVPVNAPHPAALTPPTRSPMRYSMLCTCAVIQHTTCFQD
jgi:hypothetical protein